jgi:hypothetical protein
LCGAPRKVPREAPRPRWNPEDGGKQEQPTTSKNGALRPGLRNRSTKDGTEEVSCGTQRPRRNSQEGGKQQPTTSKRGAEAGTEEQEHRGRNRGSFMWSTEAEEWKKFCAEHEGQGRTCKMEGHNNQQPVRDGVEEEITG